MGPSRLSLVTRCRKYPKGWNRHVEHLVQCPANSKLVISHYPLRSSFGRVKYPWKYILVTCSLKEKLKGISTTGCLLSLLTYRDEHATGRGRFETLYMSVISTGTIGAHAPAIHDHPLAIHDHLKWLSWIYILWEWCSTLAGFRPAAKLGNTHFFSYTRQ